jgi:hypothetical protein
LSDLDPHPISVYVCFKTKYILYKILVGKDEGTLEDISAEGRILFKWFSKKQEYGCRLNSSARDMIQ